MSFVAICWNLCLLTFKGKLFAKKTIVGKLDVFPALVVVATLKLSYSVEHKSSIIKFFMLNQNLYFCWVRLEFLPLQIFSSTHPRRISFKNITDQSSESTPHYLNNPILDTRISSFSFYSVTLRGPPLISEMGWTGELWSTTKFIIMEN